MGDSKHPFSRIIIREYIYSDVLGMGSWGIQFFLLLYLVFNLDSPHLVEFMLSGFLLTGISYFVIMQQKTLFKRIVTPKIYFDVIGGDVLSQRFFQLLNTRRRFMKIFLVSLVIAILFGYLSSTVENNPSHEKNLSFATGLVAIPAGILYVHHILINRFRRFTEFDYYLTKSCFNTVEKYPDFVSPGHSRLINNGIGAYNMYLKNAIRMNFSKPSSSYLKILSESKQEMMSKIQKINQVLESQDRLDFLRFLQKLSSENEQGFLSHTKTSKNVVELLPIVLGPVVTIFIFVASFYLNQNFIP